MEGHISHTRVVWGAEVAARVLTAVPPFYGGKMALHTCHKCIPRLAYILFAALLARDAIY